MRQLKEMKGITLIALVITIIVLLILAAVSIKLVLDGGIIQKAQTAAENTNSSQELEQVSLAVLEAKTNSMINKTDLKTELEKSINKVYPGSSVADNNDGTYTITLANGNTYKVEANGNVSKGESTTPPTPGGTIDTVKIPDGFHHVEGDSREEGIVVADGVGNEYVWIPVTKDEEGNPTEPYKGTSGELSGKVIQLQRNGFGRSDDLTTDYIEETAEQHEASRQENAIAEDIEAFKESVVKNGGYFLGRYEAGINGGSLDTSGMMDGTSAPSESWTGYTGGTLVVLEGQQVWNYVTQIKASELCRSIDTEKGYTDVTSDLVNGYAWDTAVVFIQACGTESNSSKYARQSGLSKDSGGPFATGTAVLKSPEVVDKQCNIYDMAGNCYEWSTETCRVLGIPSVHRGGMCFISKYDPGYRSSSSPFYAYDCFSFRPLLYWNS